MFCGTLIHGAEERTARVLDIVVTYEATQMTLAMWMILLVTERITINDANSQTNNFRVHWNLCILLSNSNDEAQIYQHYQFTFFRPAYTSFRVTVV